ncbi:hypothetical protein D3C72_846830 [compost metagenome]
MQRLARHRGGLLRLRGHAVDSLGHGQHRLAGFANFAQLFGRGGEQFGRGVFHLRRRLRHAGCRVLHVAHQQAQFFHRVVHRVGDGAGDVLGHGRFLRQVAFGHCLQFVHQAKNGGLVGVVHAAGFFRRLLGSQTLAFGDGGTFAAFAHLHETDGAGERQGGQRQHEEQHDGTGAQAGTGRELLLQFAQRLTQRLAVGQDGRLRFARGHQALQVAQNGRSLRAHLFVGLQDGFELLAGLRVFRAGEALLRVAVEQAAGGFLEGVQVLAQQEHGVGVHTLDREELVGRLADALRQHHELAGGRDLGQRGVLLHLQRRDGFRHFEQRGRLLVDVAQGGTHLRQDLALGQHGLGAGVGAGDQRVDLVHLLVVLVADGFQAQGVIAVGQALHAAREVVGAVLHFDERRGAADEGLRDRLGQALRLHQRLAGGRHLLRQAFRAKDGGAGHQQQRQHHDGQHDRQHALLLGGVGAHAAARGGGQRHRFERGRVGSLDGRRVAQRVDAAEAGVGCGGGCALALLGEADRFFVRNLNRVDIVERYRTGAVDAGLVVPVGRGE